MSPWSSLGLSGCRGANVSNWKDLFHGVGGDRCTVVRAGRTETWCYNNDSSKAPRFSSIIHQGFACLLCWGWFIINMIPHLQTRTNISKSSIPYKCIFFSFCYKLLHCSSHLNSFPWSEGSAMYGLWKMETRIVNTFYLHIHFCSFQTFSSRLWLWL